jgi:hypothetical protein
MYARAASTAAFLQPTMADTMRRTPSLLLLAAALAACATGPTLTTPERLALYRQHAGAPVASFRLDRMTGTQNWTPLGDQALAVWSSPNRGHLIEMRSRCSGLSMTHRISITNSMGQVTTRMDSVVPRSGAATVSRSACRIDTIRPLDGASLRDAKRELREAEIVDRSTVPATDEPASPTR